MYDQYKPISDLITNDYVLLDLPYHINTGDLLIWQGELCFLKNAIKHRMLGYYNQSTFGFPKLSKDTVILMHGGGNFGDVWRQSQNHRLSVIKHYPDNRIIILPQSVYYSTDALAAEDAAIFERHKDVTICARDNVSYEYLNRFFKNNILCIPDMAFCIDRKMFDKKRIEPIKDNLFFKRTDHEYREVCPTFIVGDYDTADWPGTEHPTRFIKTLYLSMIVSNRLWKGGFVKHSLAKCLSSLINKAFMYYVRPSYIGSGVRYISTYRNIYTTRLHGLILAHLLDKNIFIVSNNNGKLENYYNSWLKDDQKIKIINC